MWGGVCLDLNLVILVCLWELCSFEIRGLKFVLLYFVVKLESLKIEINCFYWLIFVSFDVYVMFFKVV